MKNELFDLVGEYQELYDMLTDDTVDEQTVKDTLEGIEGEIEIKAQGLVAICNRLDMEIDACEKHKKEWDSRLSVRKNSRAQVRRIMKDAMTMMGVKELKAGDITIKIKKVGGQLGIVYDESKTVPERFTKLTIETDNSLVRKALEDGEELDFAHFAERGTTIYFK